MKKTLLITHDDCAKHEISPHHPECPARIGAILDAVEQDNLPSLIERQTAREATVEELLLAHDKDYVDDLFARSPKDGSVRLDADTAMNPWSLRAARLAAGGTVQAVDSVLAEKHRNAFCCLRPPGHHAERGEAMGFCLFGTVSIAALYALTQPKINKVAIVDFDVHHGNGTEDIVGDNPNVFFCSSFQSPLYPSKYGENVPGRKINIPLVAGSDGAVFRKRMNEECLPSLRKFSPDFLLVSAGFDAHRDDPIGGLNFLEADFTWITRELMNIAKETCDGRIVSVLEGGYDLPALGRCASAHLKALATV